MATAGKVLTVLVLLAMVGWLTLMSAVTQLNKNYGMKINKLEADLASTTKKADDNKAAIVSLTDRARVEQQQKDRDLSRLDARLLAAETRVSTTTESVTRLQYQVADYLAAVNKAETNLANRKAEKAKAEEDLAAKREVIAKEKASNAELRDRLAQLQVDFKRIHSANVSRLGEITKGRPESRPASGRRPAPAT